MTQATLVSVLQSFLASDMHSTSCCASQHSTSALWLSMQSLLQGANRIQEIRTKVGGGHSFKGGRSFVKLGYNIKSYRYILPTPMFIDTIPKKSRIRCSETASEVMFGPKVIASETTLNNWNPEMTISQEHFFQLSMRKCDVSGWKSWSGLFPWACMQYWISPTPIFYTGLTTERHVKNWESFSS